MKVHNQIIGFKDGSKKTILNIEEIKEGEMTHLFTKDGKEFIINKANVNWVERIEGHYPPKDAWDSSPWPYKALKTKEGK